MLQIFLLKHRWNTCFLLSQFSLRFKADKAVTTAEEKPGPQQPITTSDQGGYSSEAASALEPEEHTTKSLFISVKGTIKHSCITAKRTFAE